MYASVSLIILLGSLYQLLKVERLREHTHTYTHSHTHTHRVLCLPACLFVYLHVLSLNQIHTNHLNNVLPLNQTWTNHINDMLSQNQTCTTYINNVLSLSKTSANHINNTLSLTKMSKLGVLRQLATHVCDCVCDCVIVCACVHVYVHERQFNKDMHTQSNIWVYVCILSAKLFQIDYKKNIYIKKTSEGTDSSSYAASLNTQQKVTTHHKILTHPIVQHFSHSQHRKTMQHKGLTL